MPVSYTHLDVYKRQMHAYLVCSAGLKLKLHICVVAKAFKHLIMRDSRLAILLIDGHFLAVIGIPAYGALYGAQMCIRDRP